MSSSASRKRLGQLAAAVLSDPVDAHALRALGLALVGAGEAKIAASALGTAARAFSQVGLLPMALAVAREIEPIDEALAELLVEELATAYGKGSARVDPQLRPRPPRQRHLSRQDDLAVSSDPGLPLAALVAAEAAVANLERGPLPRFPLFNGLSPPSFARLAATVEVRECSDGEVVVEVGSPGESLFVIARGMVCISRPGASSGEPNDVVLSHLRAGALFGEMALLTESPRTARATASTDALLLEIPRRGLDDLAAAEPEFAEVLAEYTRDRLLQNLMLTSGVFAPLDEAARARLIERFQPFTIQPGETLLVEGEPGGGLFAILSGSVAIEKRSEGDVLVINRLGPGDVVGEISLITRRPATATVRAVGRTLALGVSREDFNAIVADFPALLSHLYQLAISREQDLERFLAEEVIEADDYLI